MKYISTSTLIYDDQFEKLTRAFTERGLADKLEKKLELILEDLVIEAENKLLEMPVEHEEAV